ncbi:MAG TPA: glycosyltransferase family 39 protein [Acidimicrobiales bacterium]|nr:glycosyltransferase family 39 protein [Acidimicrobiales bacterium]
MAAHPDVAGARPEARTVGLIAAGLAVALGVAFRVASRSDLWLDEALSVHIASLPPGELVDALRRDGHPPLYYFLLHGWLSLFGEGDEAARSLSGIFAVATLPVMWVAARRYGGRGAALAAVVLLATNPFAIRYATEARMYALVSLLALTGWLAVRSALDSRSRIALTGVALTTGLLLLTHYWSFYLVAAAGAVLLWGWRRGRAEAGAVLVAMAAGTALFLPWLPAFLDQAGSTGTPWGRPQRPTNVVTISLTDWGGGTLDGLRGEAQLLGAGLAVLALLALFAGAARGHRFEVDVRTTPHARAEAVVVALTMGLAVLAGYATSSAFASRYTAGVFPLVLLVAAYGITRLPRETIQGGFVAVLAVLGLVGAVDNALTQRTQGGQIARYIAAHGDAGDVVAFCPDQLGPSVTRVLPAGFDQLTFPDGGSPRFVDWVDYEERMVSGDPAAFATALDERAAGATVWLVWSGGYRTLGASCETIADQLHRLRPGGTAVVASGEEFEHAWLYQYGPVP